MEQLKDPGEQTSVDQAGSVPIEADRIWQHAMHLDTTLFQRSNLFVVSESLLIVSYTSILGVANAPGGDDARPLLAARVVAGFGLFLTLIWSYVGHRHLQYYNLARARLLKYVPEYRLARQEWHKRGVSSPTVVTYSLPALSGVMWILLLLITWR